MWLSGTRSATQSARRRLCEHAARGTRNAAQIEEQLSLGEDADGEPTLGKPYTKEVIGAWEMRCIKTEEEVDPCQMYQLMDDGQGAPVAEFSLFRLPAGGKATAGATVVTSHVAVLMLQVGRLWVAGRRGMEIMIGSITGGRRRNCSPVRA